MAEILGVVGAFLGPAIELGKCIVEPIKRQFNYFCCFNNNIQNLRDEATKLEDTRRGLQLRVNAEENNAQVVVPVVEKWLRDVGGILAKKANIETEITTTQNGGFIVKSRFSHGKKVKKTAEDMKRFREEACNFNIISQPPPPDARVQIPLGSTNEFESRKHIEDEIIVSLKDEKTNILGICGMGGVGKTTMAKRIMHRVGEKPSFEEPLFEEIVMAVVSQKVDMLRIQDDIARSLGLELGEGSLTAKAHKLRTRLRGSKRSLIVLDDVWENLNLEDLGIPCYGGCKILLTSRDRDILKRMGAEKVHAVTILSETEAWGLFKTVSCIEQENVIVVAQQVVEECKGLPIALVTIGVALKYMERTSVWEDWLQELKSANPIDLPDVLEDVYKPLRLSYASLKSEREKSLFLLCCLYPEDDDIPLEELAIYGMGLHMFEEVTSLEQARNKVCLLVERLKARFLLLEGCNENHVKMHDVVRDVAIFIASDEKRINCDECTWHSPNIRQRFELPAIYPNLRLLIDPQSRDEELQIHDNFFEGMKELSVFSIDSSSFRALPQTTKLLKNLKTLILSWCSTLESISVIGELVNLEILICRRCYSIENLPTEMGRLSRLRLLEVSDCGNLKRIAPGIISNQKGLEELIVEEFDNWETAGEERERKNASLSELDDLSSLSCLKIKIKDCRLAAEEIRLSPNMVKYDITIGDVYVHSDSQGLEKVMRMNISENISLGKWIHECVRSVEYMWLEGSADYSSLDFGVFAHSMRSLTLRNCSAVNMITSATVFPVLESLLISNCDMMEQVLWWNGEEDQRNNGVTLEFPQLKKLSINFLPRLISFCKGIFQDIEFPLLDQMEIYNCPLLKGFVSNIHFFSKPDKVKFDRLTKLVVHENVEISINWHQIPIDLFAGLCELEVSGFKDMKSLFSLSIIQSGCFLQLEKLEIRGCNMMEQIIWWNEEENQTNIHIPLVFPKLKLLRLWSLPRLTSFCKGIEGIVEFFVPEKMEMSNCPMLLESCVSPHHNDDSMHLFCKSNKVEFGSLKELSISEYDSIRNWCGQISIDFFAVLCKLRVSNLNGMKSLFSCSIARNLRNIQELIIYRCEEMVKVIEDEEDDDALDLIFPSLKRLDLYHLNKLKSFCEWRCALQLPKLEYLSIYHCHVMGCFTLGDLNTPNLETIRIDSHNFRGNDVNNALQLHRVKREDGCENDEIAEEAAEREPMEEDGGGNLVDGSENDEITEEAAEREAMEEDGVGGDLVV